MQIKSAELYGNDLTESEYNLQSQMHSYLKTQ